MQAAHAVLVLKTEVDKLRKRDRARTRLSSFGEGSYSCSEIMIANCTSTKNRQTQETPPRYTYSRPSSPTEWTGAVLLSLATRLISSSALNRSSSRSTSSVAVTPVRVVDLVANRASNCGASATSVDTRSSTRPSESNISSSEVLHRQLMRMGEMRRARDAAWRMRMSARLENVSRSRGEGVAWYGGSEDSEARQQHCWRNQRA